MVIRNFKTNLGVTGDLKLRAERDRWKSLANKMGETLGDYNAKTDEQNDMGRHCIFCGNMMEENGLGDTRLRHSEDCVVFVAIELLKELKEMEGKK